MATLLVKVEKAVSPERLSPYRKVCGGDLAAAVELYEWNAAVSAALWLDIGHLEILVRNAMHHQLTTFSVRMYGEPRWYLNPGGQLQPAAQTDIAMTYTRLARAGKPADPGRVVAELSFGFWRYLTASSYDRVLWKPVLSHGFAGQPRRRPLYDRLARLHLLRNRLAHHEPVHRQQLARLHGDLLTVIEWIDPALRGWVEQESKTQAALATRPRHR